MRAEEVREMTDGEIEARLEEVADELFQLRMRSTYEELENPMKIRQLRREIARLKTIRHERKRSAATDAEDRGDG